MKRRLITSLVSISLSCTTLNCFAGDLDPILLHKLPSFFRFSFDNVSMPQGIDDMGLLGLNYLADITPHIYGGIGAYGALTGTQGGLFTLGIEAGYHYQFTPHFWGDLGFFVGGGGGRSSLVGGGLMIRPHVGVAYDFNGTRLGLNYSYIDFPSGEIHSKQISASLDLPFDFYYLDFHHSNGARYHFDDIHLFDDECLCFERNDFGILVQGYDQKSGTKGVDGQVQDGTISLVGAELDHYLTKNSFWYIKAAGAFAGIPNGYMDVMGGVGYQWHIIPDYLSLVPMLGIGAGGGGNVDSGGGILIQPQMGMQFPLSVHFSARVAAGYLWSPKGNMNAVTGTATVFYHLDLATASKEASSPVLSYLTSHAWRFTLFNQTYIHPQRTFTSETSPDNLIAVQLDQYIYPWLYFSYQASSAYSGTRAGGLATGMIGPGLQTPEFLNQHIQLYGQILVGASGGGGLRTGGGSIIEPVVGMHFAMTPNIGLQASVGYLKAIRDELSTPVINIGLTLRFGTLNKVLC